MRSQFEFGRNICEMIAQRCWSCGRNNMTFVILHQAHVSYVIIAPI
jgi:endonuclease III